MKIELLRWVGAGARQNDTLSMVNVLHLMVGDRITLTEACAPCWSLEDEELMQWFAWDQRLSHSTEIKKYT